MSRSLDRDVTTCQWIAMDSPVGRLILKARSDALTSVHFAALAREELTTPSPSIGRQRERELLREAAAQLREYFAGARRSFDLSLAFAGTMFQHKVWQELCEIPYGETLTYAQLARRVGHPTAWRAVGRANGANPLAIVVPCHRVVASDGTGGYAGGIARKQLLLDLEARVLEAGRRQGPHAR